MKAIKQERIIAITTSVFVLGSAIMLFVSGLGENKSNNINEEPATEAVYAQTEGITDGILSLSSLEAGLVGNPLGLVDNKYSNKDEDADTEAETEPDTEEETEPYIYENTFIVNVDVYLNVRSGPSSDSEIVGKIYRGGGGEVIEKGSEWSKITSGNIEGYINNQYAWYAEDAEAHMGEVCTRYGMSSTDSLRVRTGPDTSSDVIAVINAGAEVQILSIEGDWAKVSYIGTEAYIAAEFLEMEYVIESGVTIAEEQEAIRLEQERLAAEQKAKEEAEAARQAKIQSAINNSQLVETVQTSAYSVSAEDAYLLACLVCAEAGYESYEGKLAVANVVLNRLSGGYYGSTIYDIVYARGQFAVVTDGALNRVINNGPNAESLQAAKDALSGINNVPNYANFCALRAANYDSYAEYSIICNQVFYRRK